MKTPSFWREAGFALLLSIVGAILFTALTPIVGAATAVRGVIVLLVAIYLACLLRTLHARVGRMVALLAWLTVTGLLAAFDPTLWLWLLAQVGFIWLLRSLYLYDSLATALADAALSLFACATAVAAANHTHSMFLTLWSFFLVQALFVLIPRTSPSPLSAVPDADDNFGQAFRTAESALRRLSLKA